MSNQRIVASVTLQSRSGLSIFRNIDRLSLTTLDEFRPRLNQVDQVTNLLTQAGFTIEAQTEVGISFSGSKDLFESEFGVTIQQRELTLPERGIGPRRIRFFEASQPRMMSARIANLAEAVQLAIPGIPFHNATPPTPVPNYYFLNVLNDVPNLLNVNAVHGAGITGAGVRISMVDTGLITRVTETHSSNSTTQITVDHTIRNVQGVWLATDPGHTGTNYFTGGTFANNTITLGTPLPSSPTNVQVIYSCLHPHYLAQGYTIDDIRAVGGLDVNTDEYGHGTAEAANILAVAPGATFSFVKYDGGGWNSFPLAGFQSAIQHQSPDIISCSWGVGGSDQNAVLLEVANAVAKGIVVIFAAGNGHTENDGVISHPNLISVGGAYPIQGGGFRASNYASSFDSILYTNPQRHCPDVVGLVGEIPRACLIMLPTEPNNYMDQDIAGSGAFPKGDNTATNDGWCVCSGTSAAAPQTAGLVALLLQQYPNLSPMAVKNILENSAQDIQTGSTNPYSGGDNAAPGWDAATGFGLIDGQAALNYLQVNTFNAYIRDSIEDNGTEPVVSDRLYTSPDIIVRNEQVTNPQDDLGQTVKHRYDLSDPYVEDGQDNYVYLRVQNRGTLLGNCTATLYFTDPGMFANPANWLNIGQLAVQNLQPGEFRVAGPIVWQDAQIPGKGHYCLICILDSPNDPAPDLSNIHSEADFIAMVRDKNNVAWKNIEIEDLIPGGSSSYTFYMEGPTGIGNQADLQVDIAQFPANSKVLVKVAKRLADTAQLERLTVVKQGDYVTTMQHMGGMGILKGMDFKPRERSKVTLVFSLPEGTPDGDYPLVSNLLVNGNKVGGFTHVVRVSHFAFVGNKRTLEIHRKDCPWIKEMSPYNRKPFGDLEQAHRSGYDNCATCIGGSLR